MRNEILVNAPAAIVYAHARATEHWPTILPHYRFVRIIAGNAHRRTIEMGAKRELRGLHLAIPVRWRAEQINDDDVPSIRFRHVGGWTKGMDVVWHFSERNGTTTVSIEHEFRSPLAPLVGTFFIDPIATQTLSRMKALSEHRA